MATQKVPTLDNSGRVRQKHLPPHLTPEAQNATYVPKWKPNTAYLAGDAVLSPVGDTVTAKAAFTSGATYSAANWNLSTSYATPTALSTKLEKFSSGAPSTSNQEVFSDVAVRGALKGKFTGGGDHIGNYRQPFGLAMTYDAANLPESGGDKVGSQLNIIFKGDFTPDQGRPGGAPKWLWGSNDFIIVGDGTTPLTGITDAWSRLTEMHLRSPNMTLNNVHALVAESGFDGTATGSTITGWLASLKATGPTNSVGASVANAAAIYVVSPAPGVATNQYAIYVSGTEKSYFGGNIQMNADPSKPATLDAFSGGVRGMTFTVGPTNLAAGQARLTVKSAADPDIVAWIQGRGAQSGDLLRIGIDTTVYTRIDKAGRFVTNRTSAPALGDLADNETALYLDSTGRLSQAARKSGALTTGTFRLAGDPLVKIAEGAAPASVAGFGQVYVSSGDHALHYVNASGTDIVLGTAGAPTGPTAGPRHALISGMETHKSASGIWGYNQNSAAYFCGYTTNTSGASTDTVTTYEVWLDAGTWQLDLMGYTGTDGAQIAAALVGTPGTLPFSGTQEQYGATPASVRTNFTGITVATAGLYSIQFSMPSRNSSNTTAFKTRISAALLTRTA